MISFLIDLLIFFYIILPFSVLVLAEVSNLFSRNEKYVAPEKPYTIDDWLYGRK